MEVSNTNDRGSYSIALERVGSFDMVVVEDCMHALIDLTKKIHHFGAPKPINEVGT